MISRTGLPMVDLFFNSFATMIEMQRAFVSGGMMAAPVSSKSKAPIQPQGEVARETSMKQEVETARDTGVRVKDQKREGQGSEKGSGSPKSAARRRDPRRGR